MKKLLLVIVGCFIMCLKFQAQSNNLVMIRIQEPLKSTVSRFEATMVVIKPDNSLETIPLQRLNFEGEQLGPNAVLIKNEIAKWLDKGFKIQSYSIGGDFNLSRTEILLKKD